jgi:putative transposase
LRAVKAVQQRYTPGMELLALLELFRQMLGECIRIGLTENITSMKALSTSAYKQLQTYDVLSYYKLCAISKASGILRNYKKAKRSRRRIKEPYARKRQLTTCYGFKIADGRLLIPYRPHQHIPIALNPHTLSVLSEPNVTVESFTLTEDRLALSISKDSALIEPSGLIGIDRNLDNVTLADSSSSIQIFDLAAAGEIKALYRQIRSHMTRNDQRVKKRVLTKFGRRERNRVQQILHQTSKHIVEEAKQKQYAIAMEKLTGMRKLYRKGNGQGREYRARLNSWSFAELQRQVEYKAQWEGIPVVYVNPAGTSAKCSICGSRMTRIPEENRELRCRGCGYTVDRDVNAAKNILALGMRAVRFAAIAPASEAMMTVKRRQVDAGELTHSA